MQRPEKIPGTTGGKSQQIHSLTHKELQSRTDWPDPPPAPSKPNPKPKLNRSEENQLCIILSIDICGRQSLFGALTLYSSFPPLTPITPPLIFPHSFSFLYVCACVFVCSIFFIAFSLSPWHFPLCLLAASHFRFGNFRNFTLNYSQAY